MKIVVTGGAGFIGSAVCRHLIQDLGFAVVNTDKMTYAATEGSTAAISGSPLYRFYKQDICEREAMLAIMHREQPDAIMHLAADPERPMLSRPHRSFTRADVLEDLLSVYDRADLKRARSVLRFWMRDAGYMAALDSIPEPAPKKAAAASSGAAPAGAGRRSAAGAGPRRPARGLRAASDRRARAGRRPGPAGP